MTVFQALYGVHIQLCSRRLYYSITPGLAPGNLVDIEGINSCRAPIYCPLFCQKDNNIFPLSMGIATIGIKFQPNDCKSKTQIDTLQCSHYFLQKKTPKYVINRSYNHPVALSSTIAEQTLVSTSTTV